MAGGLNGEMGEELESDLPKGGSIRGGPRSDRLIDFISRFAGTGTLSVEEDLGHGYVRLKITEAERRQALQDIRRAEDVVVELARNARDADASNILVATRKEGAHIRQFTVIDDGRGIPLSVQSRIFESRVTSKVGEVKPDRYGIHGRGMALFSIRQRVRQIELFRSEEGRGSIFRAMVDLRELPERKDQHTFPVIARSAEGITLKGPHNILRSLMEVALEQEVDVYLGSPAEVLSTLCLLSRQAAREAPGSQAKARPLWEGIHNIRDGSMLARKSREGLGLEISQRNALRIIEGLIEPLRPLTPRAQESADFNPKAEVKRGAGRSGSISRRFSAADLDDLREAVMRMCGDMGLRYFLDVSGCSIRRSGSDLTITVTFEERV